ncbi:glycosyltransferase family 2 protein [Flavobacterium tistrianum]|uniref:glycosyltransferase family 2 protein n=1 Tax=Flavobacterium tistrianum TaxID=1685414 RepID=UPI000DABA44E|nr:glycosyltransferase [Flavobacterium tistrianum]KAF2342018.1 glycosyltransferase [Flavobacterium tistrianum]
MSLKEVKFSILITTKNRCNDLIFTLTKIKKIIEREDVVCIICDDGSTDDTATFIKSKFPEIQFIQNKVSKGLIYSRNRLLSLVNSKYAISIDDDAHFITENPLDFIEEAFNNNPKIGLLGFRIFWGLNEPKNSSNFEASHQMKSFVGCGHVWRMSAWKDITNYPEWLIFYGEEDFASYQLFKKKWEIHYLPEVLINHRVDIKLRKKDADYSIRLQRSLRAGWSLYFLFMPLKLIPRKMAYSIWMQLKMKVFKGDFMALKALILAGFDLITFVPEIVKNKNRFSELEFSEYQKLGETKIYWLPKEQ